MLTKATVSSLHKLQREYHCQCGHITPLACGVSDYLGGGAEATPAGKVARGSCTRGPPTVMHADGMDTDADTDVDSSTERPYDLRIELMEEEEGVQLIKFVYTLQS